MQKMTNIEFVGYLNYIADRGDTRYSNKFPENLGYYNGSTISFDCWNLGKSIIWSNGAIANNRTKGKYASPNTATGMYDWDGDTILAHCKGKSNDFRTAVKGSILIINVTHAGFVTKPIDSTGYGECVECTAGWNTWKVIRSKFDKSGNRYYNGVKGTKWNWTGRMEFCMDYIAERDGDTEMKATIVGWQMAALSDGIYNGTIDGVFGNKCREASSFIQRKEHYTVNLTKYIQGVLGVKSDGIYGMVTEQAVKKYQEKSGIYPDGKVGQKTWAKILGI